MALKVYYDLMSQPSRAVYMFLKLNKIPFEDKVLALRKGMPRTEAVLHDTLFDKSCIEIYSPVMEFVPNT